MDSVVVSVVELEAVLESVKSESELEVDAAVVVGGFGSDSPASLMALITSSQFRSDSFNF